MPAEAVTASSPALSRTLQQQFAEQGFVVCRGLLSAAESKRYASWLDQFADDKKQKWTLPDGVNRNEPFWPVLFNPNLLEAVREVLGPDVRYLPHNDLHVGFSSFGWHRDNVNRTAGIGPDWDETREPYRLARVGLYLHHFADSGFKLGLIKGSHRPDLHLTQDHRTIIDRRTSAASNVFSWLSGLDLLERYAEWVPTQLGDAIIFDPRILHTGSKFHGVKYSIFVAYGIENQHFRNHWHYYRNLRTDLGYLDMSPALVSRLKDAGLLAERPNANTVVDGAWLPSPSYTSIARLFK
jgi:hypothetical protein